jgi:leader peptidase (prepilin peptidase)/N-methyltransferase
MTRQLRYAAAGCAGAAAFAAVAIGAGLATAGVVRVSISGAALAAAAACDLAERRIPNRVTLPAALALLVVLVATGTPLAEFAAGLAVAALLVGIGLVWPAAIGIGDAKLALVVALGLADRALVGLACAFLLAALVAGGRIAGRASRREAIPLGPFLALGALIALA